MEAKGFFTKTKWEIYKTQIFNYLEVLLLVIHLVLLDYLNYLPQKVKLICFNTRTLILYQSQENKLIGRKNKENAYSQKNLIKRKNWTKYSFLEVIYEILLRFETSF